jgi:heme-degrading monooxygenase HmoA
MEGVHMNVRISRGRIKPGSWDLFEAAWNEVYGSVQPSGLRARALIRDFQDSDRGSSISLWDDAASATAATAALKGAMQKLEAFYTGDYEVYDGSLQANHGLFG